jgi:hypothetical protein
MASRRRGARMHRVRRGESARQPLHGACGRESGLTSSVALSEVEGAKEDGEGRGDRREPACPEVSESYTSGVTAAKKAV